MPPTKRGGITSQKRFQVVPCCPSRKKMWQFWGWGYRSGGSFLAGIGPGWYGMSWVLRTCGFFCGLLLTHPDSAQDDRKSRGFCGDTGASLSQAGTVRLDFPVVPRYYDGAQDALGVMTRRYGPGAAVPSVLSVGLPLPGRRHRKEARMDLFQKRRDDLVTSLRDLHDVCDPGSDGSVVIMTWEVVKKKNVGTCSVKLVNDAARALGLPDLFTLEERGHNGSNAPGHSLVIMTLKPDFPGGITSQYSINKHYRAESDGYSMKRQEMHDALEGMRQACEKWMAFLERTRSYESLARRFRMLSPLPPPERARAQVAQDGGTSKTLLTESSQQPNQVGCNLDLRSFDRQQAFLREQEDRRELGEALKELIRVAREFEDPGIREFNEIEDIWAAKPAFPKKSILTFLEHHGDEIERVNACARRLGLEDIVKRDTYAVRPVLSIKWRYRYRSMQQGIKSFAKDVGSNYDIRPLFESLERIIDDIEQPASRIVEDKWGRRIFVIPLSELRPTVFPDSQLIRAKARWGVRLKEYSNPVEFLAVCEEFNSGPAGVDFLDYCESLLPGQVERRGSTAPPEAETTPAQTISKQELLNDILGRLSKKRITVEPETVSKAISRARDKKNGFPAKGHGVYERTPALAWAKRYVEKQRKEACDEADKERIQ